MALNGVELTLEQFDDNPILIQKLIRAKNYYEKNINKDRKTGGYIEGYMLESNTVQKVYKDGSGYVPKDIAVFNESTMRPYRPAIRVEDGKLEIYDVPHFQFRHISSGHLILPLQESVAWVYCDADMYDNVGKRCPFTPFDEVTAQYIESQYQSGKDKYKFSVKISNKLVNYTIHPTEDLNVYVQIRDDDTNRQRHVLRMLNKEARELTAKNEIILLLQRTRLQGLANIITDKQLDIDEIDASYEQGTYKSENYGVLLDQDEVFEGEYGSLTRDDAFRILSHYDAFESGVVININ